MKKVLTIAALVLAPLTLVGSGGLNVACVDGALDGGNCYPGHVHFTGYGTPSTIHVNVARNSDGTVYDDFDYDATGGVDFTETLYPAGSYTVTLVGYRFATSQVVVTGGDTHGN
jgi:hypothetical protein